MENNLKQLTETNQKSAAWKSLPCGAFMRKYSKVKKVYMKRNKYLENETSIWKTKKVLIKRNFLVAGFRIAGYHKREDIFACVKKNV